MHSTAFHGEIDFVAASISLTENPGGALVQRPEFLRNRVQGGRGESSKKDSICSAASAL